MGVYHDSNCIKGGGYKHTDISREYTRFPFDSVEKKETIFHGFASVSHKQQKDTANQVAVQRLPSVLVRHAED
jgi:hypothetical protein